MSKRIITISVLFALALFLVAPVFLLTKDVKAQAYVGEIRDNPAASFVGPTSLYSELPVKEIAAPGMLVTDIGAKIMKVLEKVWNIAKLSAEHVATIGYANAVKYIFNRVAYDFATKLATGGKGQQPLYIDRPFGEYLSKIGEEALGKALDETGEMWGVDLCEPIERPWLKAVIHLTAKSYFEPRRPDCTWTEIKQNVGDLRKMSMTDVFQIRTQFSPNVSDFGAYLTVTDQVRQTRVLEEEAAKIDAQMNEGFKPLTSIVTDRTKTPAKYFSGQAGTTLSDSLKPYLTFTGDAAADAIGIFTNTLVSKLMQRMFTKGFNPAADNTGTFDLFGALGFLQAAKDQFAELANPDYNLGGSVDILAKLSACSSNSSEYGQEQFSCTIDIAFSRAVEQKLSLKEAVSQGLIKGDRPFGYDQNGGEPDYTDGIPYRSILILRKYRIVPVGWELAAEYFKKFDLQLTALDENRGVQNPTLNQLMALYNEPSSPYYKLVDPDWQLKAPETICYKEGPGEDIVDTTDVDLGNGQIQTIVTRRTYCADERSCISENANGNCNFYGYCVEEKPIWKIKGDACPAYYNSCQTMTDKTANKSASYLKNTLSSCTAVGCGAYCSNYNSATNNWACDESDLKFYTANKTCSSANEGCTEITRVQNFTGVALTPAQISAISDKTSTGYLETKKNIKLAPAYCDGYTNLQPDKTNKTSCEDAGNFWRSDINACVESGNSSCSGFAISCQADDVACQLYKPVSINIPSVAGRITPKICPAGNSDCANESDANITWNDECPSSCNGWRTYTQSQTNFEGGELASFLSNTAKTCGESGCDEFTNLDKLSAGGESKEYYSYLRLCVKPGDTSVKTFYTWEGSDTAGIQLKRWQLSANSDGSPQATRSCPAGGDCRSFYNPETADYYTADFAAVIFATSDCHPMRRTIATSQSQCESASGLNAAGTWTNNACVFMAAPSLSTTCSSSNAGCRTYRDNSSYNFQSLLNETFENGAGKFAGGTQSNESARKSGKSLKITASATAALTSGDLNSGEFYSLYVFAKGSGTATFSLRDGETSLASKSQTLSAEWKMYNLDLGEITGSAANPNLIISGSNVYLEEITLKKINNILVIKNSWENRALCENLSARGMTSCDAYSSSNKTYYLQKISKLCLEDAVGCEAVLVGEGTNRDWKYLVYDQKKLCTEVGCQKLGELTRDKFNPGDSTKFSYNTKYLVVKENSTCDADEEGCRQYQFKDNAGFGLYKNPGGRTCEYKEVNNSFGWYVVGETAVCPTVDDEIEASVPGKKYCLGGRSNNSDNSCEVNAECVDYATGSPNGICTSWAGICSSSASGCEEYQDPYEPEYCDERLLPKQTSADGSRNACNFYYYTGVESTGTTCDPSNQDESQHCFFKTSK